MNRNFWKANWPMAVLLVAGFLVRFGFALPGLLDHPEQCFSRPDTPGYLEPARSLAAGEGYTINGEPAMDRVPGFPLFAAIFLRLFGSESGIPALVIALIAVGTLTAIPVRWAGAIWFNRRVGTVAAALPGTPHSSPSTNTRSSTTLNTALIIRKYSGALLSPSALSVFEKKL